MHIFDTKVADPIFQEVYLANILLNLQGHPDLFYETNLLLKYQNGKFKPFHKDYSSLLQKINKIFQLYALSVNILKKVKTLINQVIVGQEQGAKHLQKISVFDILSLAN